MTPNSARLPGNKHNLPLGNALLMPLAYFGIFSTPQKETDRDVNALTSVGLDYRLTDRQVHATGGLEV